MPDSKRAAFASAQQIQITKERMSQGVQHAAFYPLSGKIAFHAITENAFTS